MSSVDYAISTNTLLTGYDTLSRAIDKANEISDNDMNLLIITEDYDNWADYGYDISSPDDDIDYGSYDVAIIECTDNSINCIQTAIDEGLIVIAYLKSHDAVSDYDYITGLFDDVDNAE